MSVLARGERSGSCERKCAFRSKRRPPLNNIQSKMASSEGEISGWSLDPVHNYVHTEAYDNEIHFRAVFRERGGIPCWLCY